jgi:hypothetical protein
VQIIFLQTPLDYCAVQCAAKMTAEAKKCLKRKRLSHVSKLSRISSPLHHWLARPNQVLSCQNNKTESEIKIRKIQKICQIATDISSKISDLYKAASLADKAKGSLVLSKY